MACLRLSTQEFCGRSECLSALGEFEASYAKCTLASGFRVYRLDRV